MSKSSKKHDENKAKLTALREKRERKQRRQLLQQAGSAVSPLEFDNCRSYIRAVHEYLNRGNESFSFQQMAEDLGLGKTNAMWQYVTGRRRISESSLRKICTGLKLDPEQKAFLLLLRDYNYAKQPEERQKTFAALTRLRGEMPAVDNRIMQYYSEWYHPIVRELTRLDDFQSDPQWIADRIYVRLRPKQITESLELLTEIGLLVYDEQKGRHFPSDEEILPDQSGSTLAMVRFHQKMSELAIAALTEVDEDKREMNTLTINICDETAQKVAELLYDNCSQIMSLEKKSKKKTNIYQVNMQMFPISKMGLEKTS